MRALFVVLLSLLVASCATPEQRAEDTANFIKSGYGPVCEKLGYTPGTDAHRNCMVSMFNADQMQRTPAIEAWGGVRRR